MILVDGNERDITDVTPEEVETVTILKDAAAVAIYGHKGINGVVNITTKRGIYKDVYKRQAIRALYILYYCIIYIIKFDEMGFF